LIVVEITRGDCLKLNQSPPQSVTGGTPKFSDIELSASQVGTPTYKTIVDMLNLWSSGRVDGGQLSSDGSGGVNISALKGLIKVSNSVLAASKFFDLGAGNIASASLTDNSTNWIYVDYNSGTPRYLSTTNPESVRLTDQFVLGQIFKSGSSVEVLTAGETLPNFIRSEVDRLTYRGFEWATGSALSEPSGLKLKITAGVYYMGGTKVTTAEVDTSGAGRSRLRTIPTWRRTSGSASTFDEYIE
jgi:hypothetical protein